ncbi:MAG TPA: hypothetical protein VGQ09_19570 [Chitinophagaceae bacterium]|jgi:hypothetical protein|nr:hypothetical protein [Chitinophagaceae bacterium]
MKRISWIVLILLFVLVAAAYASIPGKITVSSVSSFGANREGVYRFLINESNWKKWWPGSVSKGSNGSLLFRYEGYDFQIEKIFYDVIQLKFRSNKNSFGSFLKVIPYAIDSIGVELSSELNTGSNPFSRISTYFRAKKIKHSLDEIVLSLGKYAGDVKNIYGIGIKKEKVQYQHLISTKQSFAHYPTTEDIYILIGKLRDYINKSGGKELFSPMLNVKRIDSSIYEAQVGMPVDKELPSLDNITSKWMMKGGNILTGEVIGGQKQIDEATKQFEIYIRDYQRSIIAIPFQMLITDRTKQPDSTRWVTYIYYPVV